MFNSPFPPLKPTIKYKTAFERAGFEVNKSANNSINTNNESMNYGLNKSNIIDSQSSTFMDDSANSILLINKSLQKKQKLLMRKQQEQLADPKNKSSKNKKILDDLLPPKINAGSSAVSISSQNSSIRTASPSVAHLKINNDQKPPVTTVFGLKSSNTSFEGMKNNGQNERNNNNEVQEADVSHVSNMNNNNDDIYRSKTNITHESLLDNAPNEKSLSKSFIDHEPEQDKSGNYEEVFKREITPPVNTINNLADLQVDQESFYSEIQSQDPRINNIDDVSEKREQFIAEQSYQASESSSEYSISKDEPKTSMQNEDSFNFNETTNGNIKNSSQLDLIEPSIIKPSEMFLEHAIYQDNKFPEGNFALGNEMHIPPSGLASNINDENQEPDALKMESLNINEDDIFNAADEDRHLEEVMNEEATGTFFSARDYIPTNDDIAELNFESPERRTKDFNDELEGNTKGLENEVEQPLNFEDNEQHSIKDTQSVDQVELCRGCLMEIKPDEKTIYDKNGELSGKWHKKCFVCNNCNIKFSRSTPCYIHNDEPFCEEHFFEVTGLICFECKNKILDDFCLDVIALGKAHIGCFKCNECNAGIEDEYFSNKDINLCLNCVKERGSEEKMQRRRTVLWDAN
ncbi:hypothetical protein ACO0R3_000184 [Hanseniaspora guilliermondii]